MLVVCSGKRGPCLGNRVLIPTLERERGKGVRERFCGKQVNPNLLRFARKRKGDDSREGVRVSSVERKENPAPPKGRKKINLREKKGR